MASGAFLHARGVAAKAIDDRKKNPVKKTEAKSRTNKNLF